MEDYIYEGHANNPAVRQRLARSLEDLSRAAAELDSVMVRAVDAVAESRRRQREQDAARAELHAELSRGRDLRMGSGR